MSEFIFTVKCLLFAVVFLLVLQIRVAGLSLDERLMDFAENSSVASFIGDAGEGGARIIRKTYIQSKNWIQGKVSANETDYERKKRLRAESSVRSDASEELESVPERFKQKRYLDQPSEEETLRY